MFGAALWAVQAIAKDVGAVSGVAELNDPKRSRCCPLLCWQLLTHARAGHRHKEAYADHPHIHLVVSPF